jgi:hypothetical protein
MKLTGENRNPRGKTCPSATLSTTNPARTDRRSNPGLHGGRPVANRLARPLRESTCSRAEILEGLGRKSY